MPTMKIQGGDLDLVEYDFNPFLPGENINTSGYEGEYDLITVKGKVQVTVPARIHLNVLDMNRFSPSRPGGGGIGFAIQNYCFVEAESIPEGLDIEYGRECIIRHIAEVFSQTVGYNGGFCISIQDYERKHVGLGSTGSVLVAVLHAMNAVVGSPLSREQIRILVGNNYVEETADCKVTLGFETGVGPAVISYGGMAVLGDELSLVYRHRFAEGRNVYIVIPPSEGVTSGEGEFSVLMNRARSLDARDRHLKAYLVLMDLIPALQRDDLKAVGDVIWELEFRGSKRAEIEHNSYIIYQYMHMIRDAGFEFVGMSSVGPSIAIVSDLDEATATERLEEIGLSIEISTKVDNSGLVVDLKDD